MKLLIANRGEIACRIQRSAKALGLKTVAVYSEADAQALHVRMADEAVRLGSAEASASYLDIDALVQACRVTGAELVHPGYGFLSENPGFVEALEAKGVTFVGPSAKAIRAMGLKDAAKATMQASGVPIVPGYLGEDQSAEVLAREAERIGYPVLIKAVAGGGGKGMRLVERPEDFTGALESCQREAKSAFGNADVLIERYVTRPRHIEVQVFGDGARAVHLWERDCSLQRRHQKVIEEAPAPGMSPEMRDAMGQAAVLAAQAIGYLGAGTVEFIVETQADGMLGDFFFMEMNTRLQVEHPVTEAILGVDLVDWQLRLAMGAFDLPDQASLQAKGHAIEARLYAEDVPAGFLPSTGEITHLAWPEGPGVRIDTGVDQGSAVSPHYDPMIAKVIVHGETRAEASSKIRAALQGTEVSGISTNGAFLLNLLGAPDFVAGRMHTGLIDEGGSALLANPSPCSRCQAIAAVALAGGKGQGFSIWSPLTWTVSLSFADQRIDAKLRYQEAHVDVEIGEDCYEVQITQDAIFLDGQKTTANMTISPQGVDVFWANTYRFTRIDPLASQTESAAGDGRILAPMPGFVRQLFVAVGDAVEEGDRLLVMEAMKMEHALTAPFSGTVRDLQVKEGDQTMGGNLLAVLEASE
ncbi:MAG: biotin carboxylase N-terminal domain-containing protein [Pseudomonadota bacterium]